MRYTEKRYRLLERENEDLRVQLNVALRRSTGTEGSLVRDLGGQGRSRIGGDGVRY
jgi:hypothetical protein